LKVVEGGSLQPNGLVKLASATGKDHGATTLVLEYSFDISARERGDVGPPHEDGSDIPENSVARRFQVPLVRVTAATRCQTTVWLWSPSRAFPTLIPGGAWFEPPVPRRDVNPEHDRLPALVVQSHSLDAPLVLGLIESPAVIIDQALMHVDVAANGTQNYRARFLVSRLPPWDLEIAFPAPLTRLNPEIALGAPGDSHPRLATVRPWSGIRGQESGIRGQEDEGGTVARVEVPADFYRTPFILEIRYQLSPGAGAGAGRWYSRLSPPRPKGAVLLNRVCWEVDLPAGWMSPLQWGGDPAEQDWGWRGGLWTPRSALSRADLEKFLRAKATPDGTTSETPSLVCWQTALEPLGIVQAPHQLWLLVCSLLFLVLALGFCAVTVGNAGRTLNAGRKRRRWWAAGILLGVGLVLSLIGAAVWAPGVVTAVVYGCEPGLVVFLLILGVQWMLHQRYRRQVVFLPSFSRMKPSSSLVRKETGSRPRGEPSTVDAPPMRGSSAKHAAEGSKP
jgi:hypothetical protein